LRFWDIAACTLKKLTYLERIEKLEGTKCFVNLLQSHGIGKWGVVNPLTSLKAGMLN
jgi:hypothetical protein